jgi:hypothetical protein
MKNYELQNSVEVLNKIYVQDMAPLKAYFWKKLIKKVDAALVAVEELRVDLVKKNSKDGQKVDEDKMELFLKSYESILGAENELTVTKLPLVELEGLKLSPKDLDILSWLLED